MDHMKDWLGPTIEQQLERVLRWKEQDPAGFSRSENVAYEDDGSNLRMRLKKVGRLQILKVSPIPNISWLSGLTAFSLSPSKTP